MAVRKRSDPLIGIDLGGSKILAVIVARDGRILGRSKRKTRAERGYAQVLARMVQSVEEAAAEAELDLSSWQGQIGVGLPGPVDASGQVVLGCVNLGWKGRHPVARDLGKRFGLPVRLDNDVNAGAAGELAFGALRGQPSGFAVFVGTGLGGALVSGGHLVGGAHGLAGEIGHMVGPFDGALCGCGQLGCLETLASKRGIARLVRAAAKAGRPHRLKDLDDLRSGDLHQAWKAGCPVVREACAQACRALGWALASVSTVVDPSVFVLGGGVMQQMGRELLPLVKTAYQAQTFAATRAKPRIVLATLGDDAVAAGAAVRALGVAP